MKPRGFQPSFLPVVFAACLLGAAAAPAAGPSSNDPNALFPVGPLPGNQEDYKAAVEAYQRSADMVRRVKEQFESNGFKKSMLLEIGNAFVALEQAERWIHRLDLVAEPASVDLFERRHHWFDRLTEVHSTLMKDESVQKLVAGSKANWVNKAIKLQNSIPKALRLAEQEQWEEAARLLHEMIDSLTPQGVWYDVHRDHMNPFRVALTDKVDPGLFALVRNRAIDESRQAIARDLPDFAALERDATAAVQAVAAAGKASFDGRELTGPELLAAMGARWRQAQLGAWRARAFYLGLQHQTRDSVHELPKLEQEHERFTAAMVQSCCQLIDAHAAAASAGDVARLHQEYVEALAPLLELDAGRTLASGAGQSLDKLAARSPEFAADLAAYARATSDVLRWRQRTAAAQARRRQADFPDSVAAFGEILDSNVGAGVATAPSNLAVDAKANNFPYLRRVPELIAAASPKVVGRKATFRSVTAPAGGDAVAMYENRHYARLPLDIDISAPVAELKRCLFAAPGSPPLTLDAYAALATAEHGYFEQVGGQIESFELEAILTRFAVVGDTDWGLVTLGSLPHENFATPLRQVLVAFAVKPAWVQHRYGFVEMEGDGR